MEEEEARWPNSMGNAIDPCWGSIHCVCTRIARLLTSMYKCILVTEQEMGEGVAEVTSIDGRNWNILVKVCLIWICRTLKRPGARFSKDPVNYRAR